MPYGAATRRKRAVIANCRPSIASPTKPSPTESSVQKSRPGGRSPSITKRSGASEKAR